MRHHERCKCCGQIIEKFPDGVELSAAGVVSCGDKQSERLTRSEVAVFATLAGAYPNPVALEELHSAIGEAKAPGRFYEAKDPIVRTVVCHLRKKIKEVGLRICNGWDRSYTLKIGECK